MALRFADVETSEQPGQIGRFARQGMAGGGGLLDHSRVLLGHVVHLVDGLVHLAQTRGLLVGGAAISAMTPATPLTSLTIRSKAFPDSLTKPTPAET